MWWPLDVPDPRRPLTRRAHGHFAVHCVLGFVAGELLVRLLGPMSTGRALARERAMSVLAGFASWALFAGAWDRRANGRARRRRS